MIIQYVRDKNHNPIGCFVAELLDFGACYMGYSFYNQKKEITSFKKAIAFDIAFKRMKRAENPNIRNYESPFIKLHMTSAIPEHATDQYNRFIKRCLRYFRPVEIRVY